MNFKGYAAFFIYTLFDGTSAGSDEVVNLSDAIEKLNTHIWQYGLHNLSDEVLGYQTKLNQLKNMELAATEVRRELQKGIVVKKKLEQISRDADLKAELLQTHVTEADATDTKAKDALARTLESSQAASALLTKMQLDATTSTQQLAVSVKSNAEILVLEKNINALVSVFSSLKGELEANKKAQEQLFNEFEAYRTKINDLLGDANRTGMAGSFTIRKRELFVPMIGWLVIFAGSIFGLVYMGVTYLAPILDTGKLEQLPFRLALTAPIIWLGWFSAKQYGFTARLRVDYAYKEASAMSFEGYKREASQASPEMQQKLLDTAIKNLGDNPIRIYSGHENHASPLHEVLEKTLKDEKLIDRLKAIFTRVKG